VIRFLSSPSPPFPPEHCRTGVSLWHVFSFFPLFLLLPAAYVNVTQGDEDALVCFFLPIAFLAHNTFSRLLLIRTSDPELGSCFISGNALPHAWLCVVT